MVEGREDGTGKDVSPAAAASAANTDATAVLRLLQEHAVHACVPVLPPQEPRQGAAATGHHIAPNSPSPLPCSAAPSFFRDAHQAPSWGTGGGEVDLRKEANGEAGRRGIRGRGGRWGDGGGGGEAFFFPR